MYSSQARGKPSHQATHPIPNPNPHPHRTPRRHTHAPSPATMLSLKNGDVAPDKTKAPLLGT